jgi:hypothetical protein
LQSPHTKTYPDSWSLVEKQFLPISEQGVILNNHFPEIVLERFGPLRFWQGRFSELGWPPLFPLAALPRRVRQARRP